MGIERMGPPDWLVDRVRERFRVRTFIETGSYLGETAAWAAGSFERVHSVEALRANYEAAVARHGRLANLTLAHGESADFLRELVPTLQEDALFWLDAHWMGGGSHGAQSQCPLLAELAEVNRSPHAHYLLIDDARLFLAPPPLPNQAAQWPALAEVFAALAAKERYTVVIEDVIVSVPAAARAQVLPWVQERSTAAWQRHGRILRNRLAQLVLRWAGR
jgi:hypothetical protein